MTTVVRAMLKRVLAGEGYHVRSAASGAAALQVAEKARRPIWRRWT